jgi:hypothetical protein
MTELQLRKKTLLLESELNRFTLLAEWEHLREAANWTDRLKDARQRFGLWALVLAPLAGMMLARGLRRSPSKPGLWIGALRAAPLLIELWRRFGKRPDKSK